MTLTLRSDSDFYLDKDLEGAAMRDQLTEFYNKLAYWTSQASDTDSHRKLLQSKLDRAKDEAKCMRAIRAKDKGLRSAAMDAYIRNFWKEVVEIDGESITPIDIQGRLDEIIKIDNECRHNMNVCQYAVDICRSLLSWDKQELSRMPQN